MDLYSKDKKYETSLQSTFYVLFRKFFFVFKQALFNLDVRESSENVLSTSLSLVSYETRMLNDSTAEHEGN